MNKDQYIAVSFFNLLVSALGSQFDTEAALIAERKRSAEMAIELAALKSPDLSTPP